MCLVHAEQNITTSAERAKTTKFQFDFSVYLPKHCARECNFKLIHVKIQWFSKNFYCVYSNTSSFTVDERYRGLGGGGMRLNWHVGIKFKLKISTVICCLKWKTLFLSKFRNSSETFCPFPFTSPSIRKKALFPNKTKITHIKDSSGRDKIPALTQIPRARRIVLTCREIFNQLQMKERARAIRIKDAMHRQITQVKTSGI